LIVNKSGTLEGVVIAEQGIDDMLKKQLALILVGTALTTLPALAQTTAPTNPNPGSAAGTMQPGPAASSPHGPADNNMGSSNSMGSSSSMNSSTAGVQNTAANAPQFLTHEQADQWRASKLMGVDVYGPDNAKIGDINELIVNKSGTLEGVVIGVGGFLGIGAKNVAVPFTALQWSNVPVNTANNANNGNNTTVAGRASTNTAAPSASSPPAAPMGAPASGANGSAANTNPTFPDHAVLAMTKDELQNAPSYTYSDANNANGANK